jgi:hypothetical protein
VQKARVFLAAERLDVIYDPDLVDTAQIGQAVERAGYRVKEGSGDTSRERTTGLADRLAGIFAAVVAVVILVEMVGERLGLLEAALARIPPWLAMAAVLLGGYPIFRNVARNLLQRRVTSHALMTLGILSALSIGAYPAAVVIVFFMRVADYLEGFTTDRSRQAIRALMHLTPEMAHLLHPPLCPPPLAGGEGKSRTSLLKSSTPLTWWSCGPANGYRPTARWRRAPPWWISLPSLERACLWRRGRESRSSLAPSFTAERSPCG